MVRTAFVYDRARRTLVRTPCYVFDIDGTLSDPTHRLHLIKSEKPDWRAFFAAVDKDAPHPHIVTLCRHLMEASKVVFVSGRSDECRAQTDFWLRMHVGGHFGRVYMRKEGDHRDDSAIKVELLAQVRADGYEPIMAFDDRMRVVAAWRHAGVPCAQVAEGDF